MGNAKDISDTEWWRGGVIYQIYPRSYQDSNGDGIGDLPGIIERLPYIASLGVDAIWISPFFVSPMEDFGYDVADYLDVDPMFGSLDDFDRLVERGHALGIKIIIDLVLSHSSDQHPWFKESRGSKDNPKNDWYVWADPKQDGTPPNNWLSIFGGSAWSWDARRCQYYMHNFLTSQPDFNFHNSEVQDAMLLVVKFWLDRGVDGFRLDTINFYFSDKDLRDNPPLPENERNDSIAPRVNPYNHQEHLYDKNRPENLVFLARLRKVMDEYPGSTIVGEVGDAQRGLEILAEYTCGNQRAHMCYAFDFLSPVPPTPFLFKEVLEAFISKAPESWACWAFSNHDVIRHSSRWGRGDHMQLSMMKTFFSLLACLRGSICIYQGEELGLPEADVPHEALQDPYGIEFWPEFKGRDGCRTPMVWDNDKEYAGFSVSKPWLPLDNTHCQMAVNRQELDSDSLLNHYRTMIALRKELTVLIKGDLSGLQANENLLSFTREYKGARLWLAFNFSEKPIEVILPFTGTVLQAPGSKVSNLLAQRFMIEGCSFLMATASED